MKEESYNHILKDIKDIKIQGATNVALAGIQLAIKQNDKKYFKEIANVRPTEPLLQNSLKIMKRSKDIKLTGKKLILYIKDSQEKIAYVGSTLVKNDMNIFSHCHSSAVMSILKYAKKFRKKNFIVYTLEVEPLLQGRMTAEELAKAGIKVVVFPDLAAEQALQKCDLFLFGADAFLKNGAVNKIGTSMLCEIANQNKIPCYSCGSSLKYTKKIKIEQRSGKEVWEADNEHIQVINPAFDFTNKKYLTGVISEQGILPYKEFIKKSKLLLKNF